MKPGEINVPGGGLTLRDVAEATKAGLELYRGLNAGDLADEGVEVEAEVVDHRGRPVVLLCVGAHLYALPIFRMTRRTDLDFTGFGIGDAT